MIQPIQKRTIFRAIGGVILALGLGAACFSLYKIFGLTEEEIREERVIAPYRDEYEKLQDPYLTEEARFAREFEKTEDEGLSSEELAFIESMRSENPDFSFWVSVPDTDFSYPVVEAPETEPYKYLHVNFSGEASNFGCPYVNEGTSRNAQNLIIFGHHVRGGRMFAFFDEYVNKDYLERHSTVYVLNDTGSYEYELFAVIKMSASDPDFIWDKIPDLSSDEALTELNESLKKYSIFEPEEIKKNDRIITFITCEYEHTNGRLVVIGKLKQEETAV